MNETVPALVNFEDTVRVDRNLYMNLSDLESTFLEDSILARDIMIYLAHQLKTDLFGYTSFSLAGFCKIMNQDKKNLQKKHARTLDKKERVLTIDDRRYDNIFEHTLYQMASKNIILTYTDKTRSTYIDGVQAVQVLSDIKIYFDPKKPSRRIYEVKLGAGFIESLLNFYINISLTNYLKIAEFKGKGKKGNLYIYLSGARSGMIYRNETVLNPHFEMLCKFANITAKEPKHRKATLEKYLQEIGAKTDLNFSVEFYQAKNQKEAYSIRLTFHNLAISEGAKEKVFFDQLFEKLKASFNIRFPEYVDSPNYNEFFQKWLTNRNFDVDIKSRAIIEAKKSTIRNTSNSTDDKILSLLESRYLSNLQHPSPTPF